MTQTAAINPQHFRALMPLMGNDEARYYLNGISVHFYGNAEAALCATNGHVLGLINRDKAAEWGDTHCIIPAYAVKQIAALKGKTVVLSFEGTEAVIVHQDGRITTTVINGTFPDYLRVLKVSEKPKAPTSLGFSYDSMASMLKSAKAWGYKNPILDIDFNKYDNNIHKVLVRGVDCFEGAITTIRENAK